MRRIMRLLTELRCEQLKDQKREAGIPGARNKFAFLDASLSGVQLNESGGFDGPETKLQEVMTSDDFTYAIQEFIQRRMIPGYTRLGFAFEPLVKPDTTPNFMAVTRYQKRAGLDDLEYVGEKGEPYAGSVVDATKKQYRVYPFQKQFDFSMQLLVNDDLGYFDDQAFQMGESARRTLEKFVSRMYTNATTTARLIALGALYSQAGRLTSSRISEARMGMAQRTDARGEPIQCALTYLVHPIGLTDTVAQIQQSTLVPELATNGANVIANQFRPIVDPYITGVAPNLRWWAFSDYRSNGVVPFILARRAGMPAPVLARKKSDMEGFTSFAAAGGALPPIMGDFATGNIIVKVYDEWGTYIHAVDGNMFDSAGCYYSSGTAA